MVTVLGRLGGASGCLLGLVCSSSSPQPRPSRAIQLIQRHTALYTIQLYSLYSIQRYTITLCFSASDENRQKAVAVSRYIHGKGRRGGIDRASSRRSSQQRASLALAARRRLRNVTRTSKEPRGRRGTRACSCCGGYGRPGIATRGAADRPLQLPPPQFEARPHLRRRGGTGPKLPS